MSRIAVERVVLLKTRAQPLYLGWHIGVDTALPMSGNGQGASAHLFGQRHHLSKGSAAPAR